MTRRVLTSSAVRATTPTALASGPVSTQCAVSTDNAPPRPSNVWLNSPNPGWIDGARDPAIFFMPDAMLTTLRYYAPTHPALARLEAEMAAGTYSPARSVQALPNPTPPMDPAPLYYREFTMPSGSNINNSATSSTNAVPLTGHKVSITTCQSLPAPALSASRSGKQTMKKHSNTKLAYIVLEGTDRVGFVNDAFKVVDLGNEYSPGVHNGPSFKLWWPGSGGKNSAITIDNDNEFKMARDAILQKSKGTCQVQVEFDLDNMHGYRILNKRPLPPTEEGDDNPELMYGTKVPRIDGFSETDQLHGRFVMIIKKEWACEKHPGKHGQSGFCWVDGSGNHIGLNNRNLKIWATSMAAGDANKFEPPNCAPFDGFRDGRLSRSKPRGRNGPHSAASTSTSLATDPLTILLATLVANTVKPALPAPASAPTTPKKSPAPPIVFSPVPTPSSELHACLTDFATKKSINLLSAESLLVEAGFTPSIIRNVPVARLIELTGAMEGPVWALQAFCKEWVERLEEKKRHAIFD